MRLILLAKPECSAFILLIIVIIITYFCKDEVILEDPENELNQSDKTEPNKNVKQKRNNTRIQLNVTIYPTIIYWTTKYHQNEMLRCGKLVCDMYYGKYILPPNSEGAYLFYGSDIKFKNLPLPRNPQKVIWALTHEESPRNVLELMHEEGLNLFNYSSTFSRYSDVPYPLHYMKSLDAITSKKYFVKTAEKNYALKNISPILYIQSDCETSTDRDEYVAKLMKFQRIDSFGKCLNNKNASKEIKRYNEDYLNNLNQESFLRFVAKYKFVIAIENGVCDDYITEKFWRALHVGVVPIYFGSPSIRDWLPNKKSAILLEDYRTPRLLSAHINDLLEDDANYEEYLQHKLKAQISNKKLIEEIKVRPYQTSNDKKDEKFKCFICEKLHSRDKEAHIVTKSHYNCPKPICALSLKECSLSNVFMNTWERDLVRTKKLYQNIMFPKQ